MNRDIKKVVYVFDQLSLGLFDLYFLMLGVNVCGSILNVSLLPRKLSKNILWHVLKKDKRWETFYAAKGRVNL